MDGRPLGAFGRAFDDDPVRASFVEFMQRSVQAGSVLPRVGWQDADEQCLLPRGLNATVEQPSDLLALRGQFGHAAARVGDALQWRSGSVMTLEQTR